MLIENELRKEYEKECLDLEIYNKIENVGFLFLEKIKEIDKVKLLEIKYIDTYYNENRLIFYVETVYGKYQVNLSYSFEKYLEKSKDFDEYLNRDVEEFMIEFIENTTRDRMSEKRQEKTKKYNEFLKRKDVLRKK